MKSRSKNLQQGLFSQMEQFECGCGCGQFGFRKATGRKRQYINDTHKKRVMRARRKARQTDSVVVLTPKGKQLAARLAGQASDNRWDRLTVDQQYALHLLDQHPGGFKAGLDAVISLLPASAGYVVTRRIVSDADGDYGIQ